jgi:hypothetical protein
MKAGHNSQPVTEDDIHNVVNFLHSYPDMYAEAKRDAARAEMFTECILAELTLRAEGKSHEARKSRAIVQKEYKDAKEAEIVAASLETGIKARFAANELIASLYQTQSANSRSMKI